jgi:DNA-binding NarL/FixJ family response regulator
MELGWSVGRGYAARLHVDRTRRRFSERDEAMFHLVTPVLARLLRGGSGARLPDSLTVQERRVLGLVAEGRSNSEIAAALHVCSSTVRKHLEHAYRKLGVHSRLAAVMVLEEGPGGGRSENFA